MATGIIDSTVSIPSESTHDAEKAHGSVTVPTGELWYVEEVVWGVSGMSMSDPDDAYTGEVRHIEPGENGQVRSASGTINSGGTFAVGWYVAPGHTLQIADSWTDWDGNADSHNGATARIIGRRVL